MGVFLFCTARPGGQDSGEKTKGIKPGSWQNKTQGYFACNPQTSNAATSASPAGAGAVDMVSGFLWAGAPGPLVSLLF